MSATGTSSLPRVGMLATVRNRGGVVSAAEPFGSGTKEGLLHLVTLEWADGGGSTGETVVWEREPFARLLEPKALPDVEGESAMRPDDFDALVRSARWTTMRSFLDPDGGDGPLSRLPSRPPSTSRSSPRTTSSSLSSSTASSSPRRRATASRGSSRVSSRGSTRSASRGATS